MNDLERLSVLDPARGREPTRGEWARSNVVLDRIIDGTAGGTASSRRPTTRRWIVGMAVAAAAVVGVVGAVVVPSLLPGTADRALASWKPVPSPRTGAQVMPQARRCAKTDLGGPSAPVGPSDVVLAEQRGLATLLIQKRGAGLVECMIVNDKSFAAMRLSDGPLPLPANGVIKVETRSSVGSGDSQYSNVVGRVDPSVTGVDLVLADGRTIQASTRGGWWAAWWPGPEAGEADTITVLVHRSAATTKYRIGAL